MNHDLHDDDAFVYLFVQIFFIVVLCTINLL